MKEGIWWKDGSIRTRNFKKEGKVLRANGMMSIDGTLNL